MVTAYTVSFIHFLVFPGLWLLCNCEFSQVAPVSFCIFSFLNKTTVPSGQVHT